MPRSLLPAPRLAGLALLAVALAVGCGGAGPKLVPVAGTVTLGGQPLKAGNLQFVPDASRNKSEEVAVGEIRDGKYEMSTRGRKGAPLGWYKVVILSDQFSGDGGAVPKGGTMEMPKSLISLKYTTPGTTPLSVEVVEAPGPDAYAFKVTK